ncbi:TRAP transporter small permease [Aquibacillus salsiterrae]|uniref:TRAP transporter small permease n=1 Tax=Aquibacillus salsiterrae TaxID=2950439 RepID=A0A9X4AEF6_9BACI|nr:TRAP transporter small permease [Aquibacillus salsiterrae]MDC3416827.1 TRAP transporter small permease [Aquibacillus salsiterrae]
MKFFSGLDKVIMKIEEFILSYSIIIIAIMVVGNVILREIFNSSALYFNLEVSKFAIVIATFMGIAYTARKGRHISMSAFYDFLPFKGRKFMMILINFVTAIVMFVLAKFSFTLVQAEYESGTVTSALEIPQYVLAVFIPIGFFMAGIQFLRNTWINIKVKDKVYIGIDAEDYNDKEKLDLEDQQIQV